MADKFEILYDNGKKYHIPNLKTAPSVVVIKGESYLRLEYRKGSINYLIEVPVDDIAATRWVNGNSITVQRFKPCAKLLAEISKTTK